MHPAHITALAALLHAGCPLSTLAAAVPIPETEGPIFELAEREFVRPTLPLTMTLCMMQWSADRDGGKAKTDAQELEAFIYCQLMDLVGPGLFGRVPPVRRTSTPVTCVH